MSEFMLFDWKSFVVIALINLMSFSVSAQDKEDDIPTFIAIGVGKAEATKPIDGLNYGLSASRQISRQLIGEVNSTASVSRRANKYFIANYIGVGLPVEFGMFYMPTTIGGGYIRNNMYYSESSKNMFMFGFSHHFLVQPSEHFSFGFNVLWAETKQGTAITGRGIVAFRF